MLRTWAKDDIRESGLGFFYAKALCIGGGHTMPPFEYAQSFRMEREQDESSVQSIKHPGSGLIPG